MQSLLKLASDVRGKVIERINYESRCCKHGNVEENIDSQSFTGERDRLFDEWMQITRKNAKVEASKLDASLTDLALAAWYLKYVQQDVANRLEDPDKSFPWRIFCDELCQAKESAQPCCQAAMQRYRRLLCGLQRAAASAAEDTISQTTLQQ